MVKKVEKWQSSDGKLHDSEADAIEYEGRQKNMLLLQRICSSYCTNPAGFANFIWEKGYKVVPR